MSGHNIYFYGEVRKLSVNCCQNSSFFQISDNESVLQYERTGLYIRCLSPLASDPNND